VHFVAADRPFPYASLSYFVARTVAPSGAFAGEGTQTFDRLGKVVFGSWVTHPHLSNNDFIKNVSFTRKLRILYAASAPVMRAATAMTDKAKRREAMKRAAEYRQRAAEYEAFSVEAQQRGEIEMSIEFARKAAEELAEASRIDESASKTG
jgi:hypothetical protein